MIVYIVGRENSKIYDHTTPVLLAELAGFTFVKGGALKRIRPTDDDVLIRYGLTSYPQKDLRFGEVFNTAKAIAKSSNKLAAAQLFLARKISTPMIWTNPRDIPDNAFPVVRRLKHHSRGTDIKLVANRRAMVAGDYYSQKIEGNDEYRVHIFDGECIRLQKKLPTGEVSWIHNTSHNYVIDDTFQHNHALEKKVIDVAKRANAVVGLTFGAVDVLVSNTGQPYVLEVNSAPRLNKYGRQLYTFLIKRKLGMEPDLKDYSRIKVNTGKKSNGSPLEFREILTPDPNSN